MKYKHCWLLLMLVLLVSTCSKGDSGHPTPSSEKRMVSLVLGGEVLVSDIPLSRGVPTDDAYGINVYYDKEYDGLIDDLYGYGLFDNIEDMKIELLSKHIYKFECMLVKDAKTSIWNYTDDNGKTYFDSPFWEGYAESTDNYVGHPMCVSNSFIHSDQFFLPSIQWSTALIGEDYVVCPNINLYYGELDNYSPSQNEQAVIYLKRMVFGYQFVIENIDNLEEGDLVAEISADDVSRTTTLSLGEFSNTGESKLFMQTPKYVKDCWKDDAVSGLLHIHYVYKNGYLQTINQGVVLKRNTLTIYTIRIPVNPSASCDVTFSEEEWGEDNIIDFEINSDGLIDTPVSPIE